MGLEAMLRTNDRTTQEGVARTTSVNHYKNAARMAQDWRRIAQHTFQVDRSQKREASSKEWVHEKKA